jgi:beta-lactamase regulating signal transducer with metallopeptidase domain
MDIITHTTQWVNGEVVQGKITIALSIVIAVVLFYFLNFQQAFHKGLMIPISLYLLVLLGYGAFQVTQRPRHIETVSQGLKNNPKETITAEWEKAQKDNKTYATVKIIWVVMIVILGILFFVLKAELWKGISLGFIIFFIGMFIFDGFLHHRLKSYLSALKTITSLN